MKESMLRFEEKTSSSLKIKFFPASVD